MVLKTNTTGVLLAPCHDEFRGPRSDYVRQVALETAANRLGENILRNCDFILKTTFRRDDTIYANITTIKMPVVEYARKWISVDR
ncbi:hypothetical protein TNCV_3729811 [Trichonephila clavipes]|nr:hypothetical protein TNCV_3729811 [Trichonephila clavipes]